MSKLVHFLMLMLCVTFLTSCSAERRALGQMRSLTTSIERHADDYSVEDWKEAYEEFRQIDERIDDAKLSPSQQREYTELKSRCIKSFAKSSVKTVKEGVATYIKEGIGLVKDIFDSIME